MSQSTTIEVIIYHVLGVNAGKLTGDSIKSSTFSDEEYYLHEEKVETLAEEMCRNFLAKIGVTITGEAPDLILSSEDWDKTLQHLYDAAHRENIWEKGNAIDYIKYISREDPLETFFYHLKYLRYVPGIKTGKSLEEMFHEEFSKRHNKL